MPERKNPDYSESAIALVNPPDVLKMLMERQTVLNEISDLDSVMKAYPEYEQMTLRQQEIATLEQKIRGAIDRFGSYQDTINGVYGVKQIRRTVSFIAEKIRQVMPQYAEAVIDGVNKTKMNGLLKGGLITQEQADQCSQTKEDYAYIIK